ncbi:MAG: T9SS type A sorting domain-containing protein [Spirochaetes bacterium]|nr:T9SS type A sorting domain-containing protein [Spirochaetota bacterium]
MNKAMFTQTFITSILSFNQGLIRKIVLILLVIFLSGLNLSAGYIGMKTINTNGLIGDWKTNTSLNFLPSNTAMVTDNQYIWQDASNDDKGDGDYVYPSTNQIFTPNSADIDQFRVCWDANYVYFMFRNCNGTGEYDIASFFIGIDTGTPDTGMVTLIEGDGTTASNGPAVELKCEYPKMDFLFYGSSTYRARLWNSAGQLIGDGSDGDNSDGTKNNIYIRAIGWSEYEIAIPVSLIGSPVDSCWHFIAGSGFDENQMFREVQGYPLSTQWYFTGGDDTWWNSTSVDPDVADLIGASQTQQEADLSSYVINGTAGNTNQFASITYSYITVGDWNRFCIQPSAIYVNENETVPLTIMGCNSVSTGEFLNSRYEIAVHGDVGTVTGNTFTANSISFTNAKTGYITFSMSNVTTYTLQVTVNASFAEKLDVSLSKTFLEPDDEKLILNFDLGKAETVSVRIYSLSGQLVWKKEKGLSPSNNSIEWRKVTESNDPVGTGLYIIKIKMGDETISKKVLLVH